MLSGNKIRTTEPGTGRLGADTGSRVFSAASEPLKVPVLRSSHQRVSLPHPKKIHKHQTRKIVNHAGF